MKINCRDLTTQDWPNLEALFGTNGACGGCWCMSWRTPKGEKWDDIKGDEAKSRMQALVAAGTAHGVLAFDGDTPVGWCSFDKRTDYAKLDRAPSLKCDDAERVWSLPCFFVRRDYRNMGVAGMLLEHAVQSLKKRGVHIVEGYPVKPAKNDKPHPAAFAWTGTRSLFEAAGFEMVGNKDGGKQRVRKLL